MSYKLVVSAIRYDIPETKEEWTNIELIRKVLIDLFKEWGKPSIIINGDAIGGDRIIQKVAKELGIETEEVKPDYKKYHPKQAPIIRNQEMINKGDRLIAFYRNEYGGTWRTIKMGIEKYGEELVKKILV